MYAVKFNNIEKVKKLLKEFEDKLNICDENGKSLLMWVSNKGHERMCKALLKKGAIVNLKDNQGCTALHEAAKNGHLEVCRILLKSKVPVDNQDREGWTPLMAAASIGHVGICKLLLEYNAYVEKQESSGCSTLYIAAQEGHLMVCQVLLEYNAYVNKQDSYGSTPLHAAAQNGHVEVCKLLLRKNAQLDIPDNVGVTPLMSAAVCGQIETCEFLLKNGASINVKTRYGNTALYLAVKFEKFDVCKFLLRRGADVNQINSERKPILNTANATNDQRIISLIEEFNNKENTKKERTAEKETQNEEELLRLNHLRESVSEKQSTIDNLYKEIEFWKYDASEKKKRLTTCRFDSTAGKLLQKQHSECEEIVASMLEQLSEAEDCVRKYEDEIKILEIKTRSNRSDSSSRSIHEVQYENVRINVNKECPICMEEMEPSIKIFQCSEGHWLCENCFKKVSESTKICPTCRKDVASNPIRNRGLEEMINNMAKTEVAIVSSG